LEIKNKKSDENLVVILVDQVSNEKKNDFGTDGTGKL
jgi:hypothetical protein